MKKQKPLPFRPIFLLGIGIVLLGKLFAIGTGHELLMWFFVAIGLIVTCIDIFRWLHQDAVNDVREIKRPKA
ncbi:hypothetical protein [Pseudoxanthomonas mexicana]